eukprot:CAMPEP_0117680864 /NCGR_PEP_ID=MMETSP0804-20121206/18612_1 /TAXON_ID=1074897 /ORGANISM="Tetraselmis astigmatica, Strain CCMP880" /LENGTH=117 /DNA_ID=CAMNT_0005490455 /DNA_START=91 /DNA_END=444 /DNA_ORIENTATION=-
MGQLPGPRQLGAVRLHLVYSCIEVTSRGSLPKTAPLGSNHGVAKADCHHSSSAAAAGVRMKSTSGSQRGRGGGGVEDLDGCIPHLVEADEACLSRRDDHATPLELADHGGKDDTSEA